MSKEIDLDNLGEDDRRYFDERPWLKEEYERHTGNKFEDLVFTESDESEPDEDGGETKPYEEWDYNDLRSEVAERELEVEDQKTATLVAALKADDEAADEE